MFSLNVEGISKERGADRSGPAWGLKNQEKKKSFKERKNRRDQTQFNKTLHKIK